MKSLRLRGNLMLLLTALIWGSAFVAQRSGMEYIGPFTFNAVRCFIGAIVLLPVILILDSGRKRRGLSLPRTKKERRALITAGVLCGLILFVASSLQQIALVHTAAGKTGFITALYIVFVPVLGLFIGKRVPLNVWVSVLVAVVGLYFLCLTEELSISGWDILVLMCAIAFSVHILAIDHYSTRVDGIKMACMQYFVCGIISVFPMLLTETPKLGDIAPVWFQLFYAGAFSCGIAYTLQIMAQRYTEPAVASLLMSVEAVFALLAGLLLLGEQLTEREWMGCFFMFTAILLSQLPEKWFFRRR